MGSGCTLGPPSAILSNMATELRRWRRITDFIGITESEEATLNRPQPWSGRWWLRMVPIALIVIAVAVVGQVLHL